MFHSNLPAWADPADPNAERQAVRYTVPIPRPWWRRLLGLPAPAGTVFVSLEFKADKDPAWSRAEAYCEFPEGTSKVALTLDCLLNGSMMLFETPRVTLGPIVQRSKQDADALLVAMRALRQIAEFKVDHRGGDKGTAFEFAMVCIQGTARKAVREIEKLEDV